MWDLSCPDWADRLRSGQSLIPTLPLIESEADLALAIFDELQLPDVVGTPRLRDACGQWFRDIVRAVFGSWDPGARERFIRDMFVLAPKGSSKTSYSAGLMVTAMVMNQRPRAEMLFVGPTQAISDRAFDQAVGMINLSPELKRRFKPVEHRKEIRDLVNEAEMKVKTFDLSILTGSIPIFVLLDELHLLGRNAHTTKVLRQIRGGLEKTEEGFLLITTTQSDDNPAGAFKDELKLARRTRDGEFRGKNVRPLLPVLFEFPDEIAREPTAWQDVDNWPLVMPNLGRSIHLGSLVKDWESERSKGEHAIRIWASQHLNIEIGVGMKSDGWKGARYWARAEEPRLAGGRAGLDWLLSVSEVVTIGIDGGGLDDLFGLSVLGRERDTGRLLSWSCGWVHEGVLEDRKSIAAQLLDFQEENTLTIVDDRLEDISGIVDVVEMILNSGLLGGVGVDPAAIGEMLDAMESLDITEENGRLIGVPQGGRLMTAIKSAERMVARLMLVHGGSRLMAWCVSNLKIEALATMIRATKQNAGDAKIDPAIALFNAMFVMLRNPEPMNAKSFWETAA